MKLMREIFEYIQEKSTYKIWFFICMPLIMALSIAGTYLLKPDKVITNTVEKEVLKEVIVTDDRIPKLTDELVSLRKKLDASEDQVNQLRNQLIDYKADNKALDAINSFYKKQLDIASSNVFEN